MGVRTLEYGFKQFYDVTPTAFIKSQRLTRAHRMLRQAGTNLVSISGVARSLGFTHMGQFSRDYRLLFGESPTMTLQRGRQRGIRQLGSEVEPRQALRSQSGTT